MAPEALARDDSSCCQGLTTPRFEQSRASTATGAPAMTLTPSETARFYDRFGRRQDAQGFYEDRAIDDLVAHAAFESAMSVAEMGCGTGRFALRLLTEHLPASARYLGFDISRGMTSIAAARLARYAERATVVLGDGSRHFPLADHSVERVVAAYVMDLLPEAGIEHAIGEAHRVLVPGGRLCLVALTTGEGLLTRAVSALWSMVFRMRPLWVGGCRPVHLAPLLDERAWAIDYANVVVQFAIASEVLVASRRTTPENGSDKPPPHGAEPPRGERAKQRHGEIE